MEKKILKKIAEKSNIFNHLSPQDFLKDLFEAAKQFEQGYTVSAFSNDLGLGSSNVHSLMSGKRPIGKKVAEKIATTLELPTKQTRCFLLLCDYVRARTAEDSEVIFQELAKLKSSSLGSDVSKRQLSFFSHWSNAVILELLRIEDAKDSPEWISEVLNFRLTAPEIKRSLKLLSELGYLEYNSSKLRLVPTENQISTPDQVQGFALLGFQQDLIELAKQSIRTINHKKREVSTITVLASPELREKFQKEIVTLRKKLFQEAEEEFARLSNESKTENQKSKLEVVQINFQLFPIAEVDADEN